MVNANSVGGCFLVRMVLPDEALVSSSLGCADGISIDVRDLDHLGILDAIWDEMGLTELLNEAIGADSQVELCPGLVLKGLVLNVLRGRLPLYHVRQFYADTAPIELLLGVQVHPDHFNDTSLGRHLERIHQADATRVLDAFSLRVIGHERVQLQRVLRVDTTSRLVFGAYEHPDDEDVISVTYGYSKDHRPDLKQVMFGVITDDGGMPLLGRMLDGNTEDKKWFRLVLSKVRAWLHQQNDQPLHMVGDSALINQDNLDVAASERIVLTGRLPRTVAACNAAVAQALAAPQDWEDIGVVASGGKGLRYHAQWQRREVLGHQVQLGVYRAEGAPAAALHAVTRQAEKALALAKRDAKALGRKQFHCVEDARQALDLFMARYQGTMLRCSGDVIWELRKVPGQRGRPRKGEEPRMEQIRHVEVAVDIDHDVIQRKVPADSCFVVLHTGADTLSAAQILRHYRGQADVEKRFPFIKDPAWAEAFFVKRPERLEALGCVLLMALMLWTTWERRVRGNLAMTGAGPLVAPTGVKHQRPTAMACMHIMKGMRLIRAVRGDQQTGWRLATAPSAEQVRLLKLSARLGQRALMGSPIAQLLAQSHSSGE